jgi:hypothetical protein
VAVVVAVLLSWCVSSLLLAVPLGRAISANFSGRLIAGGRGDGRGDDGLRSPLAPRRRNGAASGLARQHDE